MRRDVQEIFRNTPHSKQVMMFSATLSKDIRPVCKKFMQDVSGQPINLKNYQQTNQNQNRFSNLVHKHCWSQWGMGRECFKMGSRRVVTPNNSSKLVIKLKVNLSCI